MRGAVAFGMVAPGTSREQVTPTRIAAAGTGQHVVEGQVFGGTAVLTLEMVALHDVVAAQGNAFVRHPHVALQPDDAGLRKRLADSSQHAVLRVGNHLGFLKKQ